MKQHFWRLGAILLCVGMVFGAADAVGQTTYPTQSGNWSEINWTEGQPDGNRTDLRQSLTTTVDQPYTVGEPNHQHGMLGPGYGGSGTVYIESTLTNRGGWQLGLNGGVGWAYINDGGEVNVNGAVGGQWAIRIGSDINGADTGLAHLVIQPGGVLNAPNGWTHVNLAGEPGNSFRVHGGGGSINLQQFRLEDGALVVAAPSANGAAGLTTINCSHLVIGGSNENNATGTTLRIAPSYAVSAGDSWTIVNSGQAFNEFETIETVPPDMGVEVSYADNNVTITVTDVPGAPAAPSDLTVTPYRHNTADIAWTDNSGTDYLLERSEDGETYDASIELAGPVSSFRDTTVDEGVTYHYRLTAVSPYGESDSIVTQGGPGSYKYQVASGEFSDAGIWDDGVAPIDADRVYGQNFNLLEISGDYELSQLYGPGYDSISIATLTGSLDTTRSTDQGWLIGSGEGSVGYAIIDGGSYTGSGNVVVGVDSGLGILHVLPNSDIQLGGGPQNFLMGGGFDSTDDSGVIIVEGPGSTFQAQQLRFNSSNPAGNALVVRPTGDGEGGLSPLDFGGSHFVNFGAHLVVAPMYEPSVGDSWTVMSGFSNYHPSHADAQFAEVVTIPSDLEVSVDYNQGPNNIVVTVTGAPTEAAKQPTDVSVTGAAHNAMLVSWTDNGDAHSFLVERLMPDGKATWTPVGAVPSNLTSFVDTQGIQPTSNYEYRVTGLGAMGNSAPSDSANGDSLPEPPEAPSDLTATEDGGFQIDLTWTDNSSREDGFSIERREDVEDSEFEEVATVGEDVTEYSDEDVSPARTYVYRVSAFNAGGPSDYTEEATATTETALVVELDSNTSELFNAYFGDETKLGVEVFFASDDPSFQWYKEDPEGGDPIPVGDNASILTFEEIQYEDAGVYWCEVTSGAETANSPEIELIVNQPLPAGGFLSLSILSALLALAALFTLRRRAC